MTKLAHSYSAIKLFENCPLRYYRQRVVKDIVDEPGAASLYGTRVHEDLEKRIRDKAPLPDDQSKMEPICRRLDAEPDVVAEKELVLNADLEPTTWWADDAWLRSKIDVLVIDGDRALVIDWKTGKRRPDTFQMDLFAAQVFKHYPNINTVRTMLAWVKFNETDVEDYHRDGMNHLWADVMQRIRRIYDALEMGNWPARPSGLCRYCPARGDCEYAKL